MLRTLCSSLAAFLFPSSAGASAAAGVEAASSLHPSGMGVCAAPGASYYFRQLLPGRDTALPSSPVPAHVKQVAAQMRNFQYVVGDRDTKECVVVDACWDVDGVVEACEKDGMKVIAAVATHFHYDHIGGKGPAQLPGTIPGIKELASAHGLQVYIHELEADRAVSQTGIDRAALRTLKEGDEVKVGKFALAFIHTPGHSPGSVCAVIRGPEGDIGVLSGDTVFPGSCGRLDLPGSSKDDMFDSLAKLRTGLDPRLEVFPGHAYSGDKSTIGGETRNGLLRPFSREQWKAMMG